MENPIKFSSHLSLLMLLCTLIVISCTEDSSLNNQTSPVKVKNGFLEFKDDQTFEQFRESLKTQNEEYISAWENDLDGFVSQRSLFLKAVEEENKFIESKESALLSERHSQFVLQNKDLFIFDDEGAFELDLPYTEEAISTFVNADGLLKVGTKLYQYSKNSIKVIVDGDEDKLQLLPTLSESSIEHGILVYNIDYKLLRVEETITDGRTEFSGNASCTGLTSGGGQKVVGKVYLGCTGFVDVYGNYGGGIVTQSKIVATASNYKKGVFGWSLKPTSQLHIYGEIRILAPFGSGTYGINRSPGSETVTSISSTPWQSDWYQIQCGVIPVSIDGELTFYGRDGSSCSI